MFWNLLGEPAEVLICGASRGIGLACCSALLKRQDVARVWAVARSATSSEGLDELDAVYGPRLRRIDIDATDERAIAQLGERLQKATPRLHLVISSLGVLDGGEARAENRLRDITLAGLTAAFSVNAFAPILVLKHIRPLLEGTHSCRVLVLSSGAGSIGDNHSGAWYSYRSSKAALNQLTRTASIEIGRANAEASVLLINPGTVDTDMAKSFLSLVPEEDVFQPDAGAAHVLAHLDRLGPAESGTFWGPDGQQIAW